MGLCKDFYARGGKQAAMERNIRITKDVCSTRKMRVSNDEGYDIRCDESTSQDLGVNAVSHVQKNNAERRNIPRRRSNEQGTKTKLREQTKCERIAKAWRLRSAMIIAKR